MPTNLLLIRKAGIVLAVILPFRSFALAQSKPQIWFADTVKSHHQPHKRDSTVATFQSRFPIIRNIPPISDHSPDEIREAYIYLDRVAQSTSSGQALRRMDRLSVPNDMIRTLAKYLYEVVDYNPVIFKQYAGEVDQRMDTGPYNTRVTDILTHTELEIRKLTSKGRDRDAIFSVFVPDYVLRVEIISIDSMRTRFVSPRFTHRFRAIAVVLDTLKGRVFQNACNSVALRSGAKGTVDTSCIAFQFTHINYFDMGNMMVPGGDFNWQTDSSFANYENEFEMHIGQEAIIFLNYGNHEHDSTYDYYDLDLEPSASFNALPIINGKVRDVNHIWSDNTLVDYGEWKKYFEAFREKLLNGTF